MHTYTMAKHMCMAMLIILINDEIFCNRISAQADIISGYTSFHNNPDKSITEYEGDITTSDMVSTTADVIRRYGYPVETHTVTTEDGYLLTVYRIPGSPRAPPSGVKTPVLLWPGLSTCSDSFLFMGPKRSLGFLLANQGYDVWIGNFRGNVYARQHLTLSPKNPKFWNFTWHEMGVYDLPATIDHVLNTTDHQQLLFLGHSMGNTAMFVLGSTRPEYNKKIRLFVALGPTVYIRPLRSELLTAFVPHTRLLSRLAMLIGLYDVPRTETFQTFLRRECREGSPLLETCIFFTYALYGGYMEAFDRNFTSLVFSQGFGGIPINALVHYAEISMADRFQVFDPTITLGKFTPEYNLTQVSAPVYILYADKDVYVHPDNVMRLRAKLPNVVGVHRVQDDLAHHTDFVLSKDVKRLVNDVVIAAFEKYK